MANFKKCEHMAGCEMGESEKKRTQVGKDHPQSPGYSLRGAFPRHSRRADRQTHEGVLLSSRMGEVEENRGEDVVVPGNEFEGHHDFHLQRGHHTNPDSVRSPVGKDG